MHKVSCYLQFWVMAGLFNVWPGYPELMARMEALSLQMKPERTRALLYTSLVRKSALACRAISHYIDRPSLHAMMKWKMADRRSWHQHCGRRGAS